jgi:hypothetical protein
VTLIDGIVLETIRGAGLSIGGTVVGRQRKHGLRKPGVVVAVLLPSVANEHEITAPTRLRSRLLRESQPELVASVHDHITVVDLRQ